jgi:hypothetical protein
MRVLQVVENLDPRLGGTAVSISQLANRLPECGADALRCFWTALTAPIVGFLRFGFGSAIRRQVLEPSAVERGWRPQMRVLHVANA